MINCNALRTPLFISLSLLSCCIALSSIASASKETGRDTVIIKAGFANRMITPEWKQALNTRETKTYIDSLSRLQRDLTVEEQAWQKLIQSKTSTWKNFTDSLAIPFAGIRGSDTTYIILGYHGHDDGFTYGYQTVCLDLTALQREYGRADIPENNDRIDRIFVHEYTHLLHKRWAAQQALILQTFHDSILWECLYEGLGMYRSLNPKWMPVQGGLPAVTQTALHNLYPIFVDRLITVKTKITLSPEEKRALNKNLSRGHVSEKWGAFPVAIWLALEANGNDKNLQQWIDRGPAGIIHLAKKYLPAEHLQKFNVAF
jgi:hypothetical protein